VTRFKHVDFQAVKIQTSGAGTEGREMIQCNGSRSSLVRVVASAVLAGLSMFDQAAFAAERAADLASHVSQDYPFLESLYRDLHAHPELSFREEKTAAKLARELKANGVEVTTGVGGHGLVGVLRNGPGPTVLVRTDLDALPVREQTGLPFASRARMTNDLGVEVDVMHACGHDVHITSLVGTARQLARLKESWSGTVVFLGQPAEERGAGARAMLKDGLFTRFPKPDFCLALHVSSDLPAGTVGVVEGFMLANVDSVDITVRGVGGHGAWPHKTKDPVVLAAQTIMALQTIVSRETDPLESAVVTVGSVHGGTKHNIIPDEVKLQLTVRSFTDEVRANTLASIKRIARAQALSAGVPEDRLPEVTVDEREFTPATYNNPELARRLRGVFTGVFGEKSVVTRRPVMGGEDFSEYGRTTDRIPICIFWLGSVEPERVAESERTGKPLPALHSALYRPMAEPTIKTGVTAMTAAVLELTGRK
jgi:hippurate hydrolase